MLTNWLKVSIEPNILILRINFDPNCLNFVNIFQQLDQRLFPKVSGKSPGHQTALQWAHLKVLCCYCRNENEKWQYSCNSIKWYSTVPL